MAMPDRHPESGRVRDLLTGVASEFRDPEIKLVFAEETLSTHALLVRNLRRLVAASDAVLCFTDGRDPDVSFEAGVAVGLGKPLVVVILPGTWVMPETFVGHFYVELAGDSSDPECLKSALIRMGEGITDTSMRGAAAGRSIRLPRFACAVGMERRRKIRTGGASNG
jgi:hypothetical protein